VKSWLCASGISRYVHLLVMRQEVVKWV